MTDNNIRSVAIIGANLTGWTAAAALAHVLQGRGIRLTVLDMPGVANDSLAEATLPFTQKFHYSLGIDERDIMAYTQATFRLGTEFKGWWGTEHDHFLPLGAHGAGIGFLAFHHYAIRQRLQGDTTPLNAYSLAAVAAGQGKFAHPVNDPSSPLSTITYGLHVDSARYAGYMRLVAEQHQTRLIQARVASVRQDTKGHVEAIELDNGNSLEADFYIDCSGPLDLLVAGTQGAKFLDWSASLPFNRAASMTAPVKPGLPPFSSVQAHEAGWIRSIPLQDLTVREFVYSDAVAEKDDVAPALNAADGQVVSNRTIRTGRLDAFWKGNCLALGQAAGGLDPLAAGQLHLVQRGILRFLEMFPDRDCNPVLAGEYNQQTVREYDNLRDFHLAHYLAEQGPDTGVWAEMKQQEMPPALRRRLEIFDSIGQLPLYRGETFNENEWASLLLTQGRWKGNYNHALDALDAERLDQRFAQSRELIKQAAAQMPVHEAFLTQYCPAVAR